MDPYIGEIRLFAGNFAPYGWALCDGSIVNIVTNTALFAIIGTTYGGNGQTTFALPDLRGRVPMHWGNGQGLTPRRFGESGGTTTVTLQNTQMPIHTHQAMAVNAVGTSQNPSGSVWAQSVKSGRGGTQVPLYAPSANTNMSPQAIAPAGNSLPHNNRQPYLGLNYIIATMGIFPPRS